MTRRRWFAALALLAIGLAGCGPARLMLPAAEPEASLRTFVRERMRVAQQGVMEAAVCQDNTALHATMRDLAADLVSHPDARHVSLRMLETIFFLGVQTPDMPVVSMSIDLEKGGGDEVLLAANWCGYGEGRWLYVISRDGEVWDVSDGAIGYAEMQHPPDVRWLGDGWAVITTGYPMLDAYDVHIIARRGAGWEHVYNTHDPWFDRQQWGMNDPVFRFEDGYNIMTITGFSGGCARERRYKWQDAAGTYELASERMYGLWTCDR